MQVRFIVCAVALGVTVFHSLAGAESPESVTSEAVRKLVSAASNATDRAAWIQESAKVEAELGKERERLDGELRKLIQEERAYRETAVKGDEKIQRQQQRIAALQAEMDAMVQERHPRLKEISVSRSSLLTAHREIVGDLSAVRSARIGVLNANEKHDK